jgi:hypothetical protein
MDGWMDGQMDGWNLRNSQENSCYSFTQDPFGQVLLSVKKLCSLISTQAPPQL